DQLDGRFQRWITELLHLELASLFGDSVPTGPAATKYVIESRPKKKLSGGRYLTEAEVDEIYKAWADDHSPTEALAFTLQDSLTSAMGNKARDWFTAVGRHCGFVGPRRGQVPRLRAEVSLVPSLLLAGMDEHDPPALPFDEWAHRLTERIGVVIGP